MLISPFYFFISLFISSLVLASVFRLPPAPLHLQCCGHPLPAKAQEGKAITKIPSSPPAPLHLQCCGHPLPAKALEDKAIPHSPNSFFYRHGRKVRRKVQLRGTLRLHPVTLR